MIEHSLSNRALLDQTYRALADSTRRGMLVTLRDGPARISDMAAPLPMSFAAAARHVAVLEAAGLRPAEEWIAEQVSFWSLRADALAARLERRNRPEARP